MAFMADMEVPPISKKLSKIPTFSTLSNSENTWHISSSSLLVGAMYSTERAICGSGRALRFTLPFGVSGNDFISTKAAGTIYSVSPDLR